MESPQQQITAVIVLVKNARHEGGAGRNFLSFNFMNSMIRVDGSM
jgi:hypothetical protein